MVYHHRKCPLCLRLLSSVPQVHLFTLPPLKELASLWGLFPGLWFSGNTVILISRFCRNFVSTRNSILDYFISSPIEPSLQTVLIIWGMGWRKCSSPSHPPYNGLHLICNNSTITANNHQVHIMSQPLGCMNYLILHKKAMRQVVLSASYYMLGKA